MRSQSWCQCSDASAIRWCRGGQDMAKRLEQFSQPFIRDAVM